MLRSIIIFCAVFTSLELWGARVLRVKPQDTVVISQDPKMPWVEGEEACVHQNKQRAACGTIVQSFGKVAVLKIEKYESMTVRKKITHTKSQGTFVALDFNNAPPKRGNKVRPNGKRTAKRFKTKFHEVVKNQEHFSGWPRPVPKVARTTSANKGWPARVEISRLTGRTKWGWPTQIPRQRRLASFSMGWPNFNYTPQQIESFFNEEDLPNPGKFEKYQRRQYHLLPPNKRIQAEDEDDPFSSQSYFERTLEREGFWEDKDSMAKQRQLAMAKSQQVDSSYTSLSDDLFDETVTAISAGISYIMPFVHFQQNITRHFALGVSPSLLLYPSENAGLLKGFGAHVTLHYYSEAALQGIWGQLGLGYYSVNGEIASQSEVFGTGSVLGTIGYRYVTDFNLTFALAGGVQYITKSSPDGLSIDAPNLLPSILIDIGLTF